MAESDVSRRTMRCRCFKLVHISELDERTISTADFSDKLVAPQVREPRAADIADHFDRASQAWAARIPRRASFAVNGYTTEDPDAKPVTAFPFMQVGEAQGPNDLPAGYERATDTTAMAGHLARSLDTRERQLDRMCDRIMDLNRDLLERVDTMFRGMVDMRVRTEEALDNRSRRDAEAYDMRLNSQLKEKVAAL